MPTYTGLLGESDFGVDGVSMNDGKYSEKVDDVIFSRPRPFPRNSFYKYSSCKETIRQTLRRAKSRNRTPAHPVRSDHTASPLAGNQSSSRELGQLADQVPLRKAERKAR